MNNITIRKYYILYVFFVIFVVVWWYVDRHVERQSQNFEKGEIVEDARKGELEAEEKMYKNRLVYIYLLAANLYIIYILYKTRKFDDKKITYVTISNEVAALGEFDADNEEYKNQQKLIKSTLAFLDVSRKRLLHYIDTLKDRNSYNLLMGMAPAAAVFFVLFQTWQDMPSDLMDVDERFVTFRVFTVIFIQSFSFFFLIDYRRTLAEIRYYQNELSNIETKYGVLAIAQAHGQDETIKTILKQMAETERNFPLKEGERLHGTKDITKVNQGSFESALKKLFSN